MTDYEYILSRTSRCAECNEYHPTPWQMKLWIKFCIWMGQDKDWIVNQYWKMVDKKLHKN